VSASFTGADVAYIRANYVTLAELCADRPETPEQVQALITAGLLPRPSYVLDDGTAMFPADYFRLVDDAGGTVLLREHFAERHRAACHAEGIGPHGLEQDWQAYLGGIYGVCLHEVKPETIVRKGVLVSSLCELLTLAEPRNGKWRDALRSRVEELDALEREFSPDYDRSADRERPPTRDLLVAAARKRFPEVFEEQAAA
jgi:uncharacterized protein DUF6058